MTTFERLKLNTISGGVEKAAYMQILDKIQDSNQKTLNLFSIISTVAFVFLTVASVFSPSISQYRPIYITGLIVSVLVWYIANYPGKNSIPLLRIDVYLFACMLMTVGILLGTIMNPQEISAVYLALLLAVPQVFTDRPWRMYLLILISVVAFIIMTVIYKDPVTRSSDIVNSIVFGVVSIVLCTYTITDRIKRYSLEFQIRYLAENDSLTGLKNRYCYQQYLDKADVLKSKSIYCIYVDVNGLHELNDTQGHEAGDRMLQFIASVMQHQFGKENTYRIGGDEFVALGIDRSLSDIEAQVEIMKQAVESAGYHIAAGIGIKEKKEIEIDSIIKDAEEKMYQDKAAYYQQAGKDRRRKR